MIVPDAQAHQVRAADALQAAMSDLARLTLRASTAPFDDIAAELLGRLLNLAGADRGAILAGMPPGEPVALHGMSADDARAAFASSRSNVVDGSETRAQAGNDRWLIQLVPLGATDPDEPGAAGEAGVLLGWDQRPPDVAELTQGRARLLAVAESVGAALTMAFLAERTRALQTRAREEADALKGELLGTVSHELRSPLAVIRGYAETLRRYELRLSQAEREEFLNIILASSARLERVIDRLLELSDLESGSSPVQLMPLDMRTLVRDAVEAGVFASSGRAVDVILSIEDAAGRPAGEVPAVLGDVRRMREVVDELLLNAAKHAPEGDSITITLRPVLDALEQRRLLELRVRDQGAGIPAQHLERVFERFHRVDSGLTRQADGLGLGLAICKRIVELHGGGIWSESEPGKGTTMVVRLPVLEETSAA